MNKWDTLGLFLESAVDNENNHLNYKYGLTVINSKVVNTGTIFFQSYTMMSNVSISLFILRRGT